jgi:hypothetical protein
LALFDSLDPDNQNVRQFYASVVAGAVGAIVSVLMRMSRTGDDRFTLDHELGSSGVMHLGAFRPIIGAISGVVVALLIKTTLIPIDPTVQQTELYAVAAFLAGFSERWTKVVLGGAMRTIAPGDGDRADLDARFASFEARLMGVEEAEAGASMPR